MLYLPCTVSAKGALQAAAAGSRRRRWTPSAARALLAPRRSLASLQAASVLFGIISLVTFGDLAQVQYDESAGHVGSQVKVRLCVEIPGASPRPFSLHALLQPWTSHPVKHTDSTLCLPTVQLNGAMAATFMGPILTGGLLIMSFFLLVRAHRCCC